MRLKKTVDVTSVLLMLFLQRSTLLGMVSLSPDSSDGVNRDSLVSLQIVIERNVLTEKCSSSHSVGMSLKILASSDDQVFG